jgi:hypothetical protein
MVPPELMVEGNPDATVVRLPVLLILEILAVSPPVYGPGPPGGPGTCVHDPAVLLVPPRPASAT